MKYIFIILSLFISVCASAKPLEKVSLQLQWLDQFQFAGYYMAKEKGFYEDAGFDVKIKKFSYSTNIVEDVLSGRSTYGIGRSNLIYLYSKGKEISLLSSSFQSSPYVLIALKSSAINSIEDFRGKTLMLKENDIDSASVYAMINSHKANKNSMKFKKHTFNLEELIDGRVDLYAGYTSNELYALNKRDIPFTIFSPKDRGFDFYSDLLFTSQNESRNHPERVQKFIRASIKGWEYAFSHIDETIDTILKKYNPTKKTREALIFEARELKKLAYTKNGLLGVIEKSKIERILDIYRVMGLIKGDVNLDRMIFSDKKRLFTAEEEKYLKDKKKLIVCMDSCSMPFSAIEDGKFVGISSGVLKIVDKHIHVPVKLLETEIWDSSECDIIPLTGHSASIDKHFKYTTPYHSEPLVIVTSKFENYILDIETMLDKKFAILKGTSFEETLKKKYPDIKLDYVSSFRDGFRGVENGKYYGYIDNLVTTAYAFEHIPSSNLKISGQFNENVNIGFAVRGDDEILFNIFEKLAKNIRQSDIHKLTSEWVSINYTQNVNFEYLKEIVFAILFILFIFFYRQHILKKKNIELESLRDDLLKLNQTLELKISRAVDEMQKQDTYMLHKSRLAQMGEMISIIAHQWKQPLSSISTLHISMIMAIELEQYDLCDANERKKFLNYLDTKLRKIGMHTQNLSQIISDFSDFYRPSKHQEEIDLGDVVVQAFKLLEDSLSSVGIDVCFELSSTNRVKVYKNEFIQVILNVIGNAKEQFIEKNIDKPQILITSYDKDDVLVLKISDNAGGIDEEIINNIFDPYFSTKFDKNGTGLGLYMSKNIIEQHHNGKMYTENINNPQGVCIGVSFIMEIRGNILDDEK